MKNISFECEIITPMFLAGADGRTPDLRPPSIKGALRFWWRAMNGHKSIDILRKEEISIFGGGGTDAVKSKVIIRIIKDGTVLQKKKQIGIQNGTGNGYLLYSSLFVNRRDCLEPRSEKKFILSFESKSLLILEETVKAFACLVFFGGLGSRTRRGAGSIFVKNMDGNAKSVLIDILKVFDTNHIKTKEQLKDHIEKYLKPFINAGSAREEYSALNGACLYFLDNKDNWEEALEEIGSDFKGVRSRLQSQIGKTPNFGFPIQHRECQGQSSLMMVSGTTFFNGKDNKWESRKCSDRRASPLVIKTIKTSDKCYFPIALHFKGKLLPAGQKIIDKRAKEWQDITVSPMTNKREDLPDDTYIQHEFLNKLTSAISTIL